MKLENINQNIYWRKMCRLIPTTQTFLCNTLQNFMALFLCRWQDYNSQFKNTIKTLKLNGCVYNCTSSGWVPSSCPLCSL